MNKWMNEELFNTVTDMNCYHYYHLYELSSLNLLIAKLVYQIIHINMDG